jgi:hypothetical protein
MLERPAPALLSAIVVGWLLMACASAKPPASGPAQPGGSQPRPVLESVNPVSPEDRAAAARRAWLERQAAARRGGASPSAPAPPAAAAGIEKGTPGKLLIFSSVTGHVPIGDVRRPTAGTPEERENQRTEELERALEAERAREEQPQKAGSDVSAQPPASPDADASVLVAPAAPPLPEIDRSLFVCGPTSVPAGSWDNAEDLPVVRCSLDRDGNGRPEEIRYYDVDTNELLRREEDRDLDGNTDTWSRYEHGELVMRVLATDADGRPDEWETYANGRMMERDVDTDHDGNKDAIYIYRYDSLVEVRRDTDGDGKIDHVEHFEHRMRVQAIDDTNGDERMDTWTTYQVVAGKEVVVRIERDPKGIGKPTVFETYAATPGPPVLLKREEDLDGDGTIDVTRQFEPSGAAVPEKPAPL